MIKKEINVLVDERPVKAPFGYTIMQTCSRVGVDIPRFCYHDKLLIAGNCRICLIEVVGTKKLVAACAVHISDNMSIYTNTARVRLARQNVLEFLLANHPLDCPICDQGGECDLQDITSLFGADRGRFYEQEKRSVLNKDFGPLIRTSMNRCIHCTRCVRFLAMSSGFSLLGTMGRGVSTEISLYVNQFIMDELSGNITDLCPVGALTSKPYSFKARPWELTSLCSIDIFDSMNSPLIFEIMANKICRVLPYANDFLNECWLTNKARYAYDGLFVQRLNSCLFKVSVGFFSTNTKILTFSVKTKFEVFVKLPWAAAFQIFLKNLFAVTTKEFVVFAGNNLDIESLLSAKLFSNFFGGGFFFFDSINSFSGGEVQIPAPFDFSFLYLFNTSLLNLSKLPSFCLLIGANLRFEVPLLNLRLTNLVFEHGVRIYRVGGSVLYTAHKTTILSNKILSFYNICEFKHPFCKNLYLTRFSYRPFLLAGVLALNRTGASNFPYVVLDFVRRILRVRAFTLHSALNLNEFNFFGFVFQYSSQIHAFDVGLGCSVNKFACIGEMQVRPVNCARTAVFYSVGFTNKTVFKKNVNSFLVFQGSHGDGLVFKANLILPVVTYIEKIGNYRNLRGIVQKSNLVVDYAFDAKSDAAVFQNLVTSVEGSSVARFFTFTFRYGLLFNFSLSLPNEFFFNRDSDKLTRTLRVRSLSDNLTLPYNLPAAGKLFYYYEVYAKVLHLSFSLRVNTCGLSNPVVRKIFTNLISSSTINYYGDSSTLFLRTSKTMMLCSNLFLKKNLSFSPLYF